MQGECRQEQPGLQDEIKVLWRPFAQWTWPGENVDCSMQNINCDGQTIPIDDQYHHHHHQKDDTWPWGTEQQDDDVLTTNPGIRKSTTILKEQSWSTIYYIICNKLCCSVNISKNTILPHQTVAKISLPHHVLGSKNTFGNSRETMLFLTLSSFVSWQLSSWM